MLKGKLNLMIHIYIYLTNLINCIFASKYDINIKDAYGSMWKSTKWLIIKVIEPTKWYYISN